MDRARLFGVMQDWARRSVRPQALLAEWKRERAATLANRKELLERMPLSAREKDHRLGRYCVGKTTAKGLPGEVILAPRALFPRGCAQTWNFTQARTVVGAEVAVEKSEKGERHAAGGGRSLHVPCYVPDKEYRASSER